MSSRQNRKSLNVLNDTLRADNSTLKSRECQFISHIQTLIRRQKQLSQLKQQLMEEAQKSKILLDREKFSKQDKCIKLQMQLSELDKQAMHIDLTLANLQEQYQICLDDYDKVLSEIAQVIQKNKVTQLQVAQQKQKRSTIQTMIFDYQRLQRVLQQQRKYFKQLSSNEQKTHIERIKQFQSIRSRLIKQEKQVFSRKFMDRFKMGFIKLNNIFKSKFHFYGEIFIRGNFKYQKLTDIGISKFKNCLQFGQRNYKKELKRTFTAWHHNAFPKNVLNNIVQNSLRLNLQSKLKIKTLNKIMQKLNSDNLNLLHLYERTKIVCLTAKSLKHKQLHLAFCRWRDQSALLSKVKYRTEKLNQVITSVFIRNCFNVIKTTVNFSKRFQVASHLLSQYENSKDLAWAMRIWRLQIHNRDIQVIQKYIQNIKKHNLIKQRVKYEKRKVKALTNLQLSLTKIQLRNYFSRYYQNAKLSKLKHIDNHTENTRQLCIQARKQNKNVRLFYKQKYRELSLTTIFQVLAKQIRRKPFQHLKTDYEIQKYRKQSLMLVILKKQGKNKYYAINELRKNVQHYQKKQMHQVLTDLNRKMEQINQKSTTFRQALKKTIQDLGNQSSKKISQVFQYTLNCQRKVYFNWNTRKSIQKKFKYFLLTRTLQVLTQYSQKNVLKTLSDYCKNQIKQKILLERQKKFLKSKQQKLIKRTFFSILNQLKLHKKVFSKFIHAENVMYFYRLQCAMIAIMKKAHQQTLKVQNKNVDDLTKHLSTKKQNFLQLRKDKNNLQQKLKNLFSKFVCFQQISQKNKQNSFLQSQKLKYFRIYRKNVQKKLYANQVLSGFVKLLQYKNYFIFWKSIYVIGCESQQVLLKDELGKVNKKKKNFEEKTIKARADIQRKLGEQEKQHEIKQNEANYYVKKYTGILAYYDKNHQNLEKQRYLRSIFYVWKRQFLGAKKFGSAIYNMLRRTQLIDPYRVLFDQFKKYDNQFKSQLICSALIEKKYKKYLSDGFNYWRYNMRHGYTDQLRYKVDHIDEHHEQIKNGIFSRGQSYANQVIRNKRYKLKSTVLMAFKNQWIRQKHTSKKIDPLIEKTKNRRIFEAVRNWKWLLFYKKTKRSFLTFKKEKFNIQLKRDVFNSLKIYRQSVYDLANLTDNFVLNRVFGLKRFSMSKIINVASHQRNELNYERKKALYTLLTNKMARQRTIKQTVMWKWQSELISRKHYLCNVLKSIQQRILKSTFANINEKKYWNQFYIKDIADKITTEGYSQVNSVTNILIREGFDPDELKDYLKVKNEKDNRIISKVVGHLKAWPKKQKMLQAFHSWVEYVQVRKNIKRSLTKVFNFSTGLGRYFDKWKKKDPAFNEILQRQSRANMLQRYNQLERLMKQYRRDIKDSLQNCQQLRQINDVHAKSTKITVQAALSNVANSVYKGMRRGLQIWRIKAKQQRTQQTNQRYDQLVDGISMLDQQKRKVKQKIQALENQNMQLKQKCKWGEQCGELLGKLMNQKDGLTIDLAQKQHNLKILLEDNLRLKQKIRIAKQSALKLITKVKQQQGVHS